MTSKTITVVTDSPGGWFDPYAADLVQRLAADGHSARLAIRHDQIPKGDIAFHLACTRITPPEVLARNALNLVVHASHLPKGRGFSPLVWQILEGLNDIPVRLIEALDDVDSGAIRMAETLRFQGHELNEEMRARLGEISVDMCIRFVREPQRYPPVEQVGEPSWYERRRPRDSRLDTGRTLADQFPLLRVVDNERYPAFFDLNGRRYVLRVEDAGPSPEAA